MKTAPPYGHEENYRIRTHEIDHRKLITIPSLIMLMQEASMQNVIDLKLSVWDLEHQKISWVILRKELQIVRMPRLGERIRVITYPAGFDRVFAYRDFWVYDEKDDVLAKASSTWTLLNTETRKLQRIPQEMLDLNLPQVQYRLPLPDSKIVVPEEFSSNYKYQIRSFDLDWNFHVNNVVLSKLMLQAISVEKYDKGVLLDYKFHVKNECYLGENLLIESEDKEDVVYHRIIGEENKIVAVGASFWEAVKNKN